jgi:5-methylcytosine-specific restriction endonuclease McrA
MDSQTRTFVHRRAAGRCEYCRLLESVQELTFHVEHIVARQHGGGGEVENLALACDRCNVYKGPNLSAIDPDTRTMVRLFHPRQDRWEDHFRVRGMYIDGISPIGRATVHLLRMNAAPRLRIREQLKAEEL